MENCLSGNYRMPEWVELGSALRVIFFPHQQTLLPEPASHQQALEELLERQKKILALFRPGEELPFRFIFKLFPGSIAERTLRNDLRLLRKKKLLFSKGKSRATVWYLKSTST